MKEHFNETLFELNEVEKFKDTVSSTYSEKNAYNYFKNRITRLRFPENLIKVLSNGPSCRFAYSSANQQFAVLLSAELEIRGPVSVSYKILPDENEMWRTLTWSASGNLLLASRSSPTLDVFDVRNYCYTIELENSSSTYFDPFRAVSEVSSKVESSSDSWSDEVYVLQYCGILRIYYMGRISGYHPVSVINLHDVLESSICLTTSMLLLPEKSLLLIANAFSEHNVGCEYESLTACGVRLTRLLDSAPFLALANENNEKQLIKHPSKFSFFDNRKTFCKQMILNSDGRKVVCLVSSSDIYIFAFPVGKKIIHRNFCDVLVTGVAWWTDEMVLVAFSDGRLTFLNEDLKELAHFEKWISCFPISVGHCFIIEKIMQEADRLKLANNMPSIWRLLAALPYRMIVRLALLFVGAPQPVDDATSTNAAALSNEIDENEIRISYVVHEVKAKTPEELFETKLSTEQFAEALSIAEKYNLDMDKVYQTRWLKNPISISSIDDYLMKIKNTKWVVDECVRKVSPSVDVCRYLLRIGLKLTDIFDESYENKPNLSNDEIHFLNQRCRLLKFSDRLEDYEEIRKFDNLSDDSTSFDMKFYVVNRTMDTLAFALYLTRNNFFLSLLIMFQRYSKELFPFWLFLLNNVSETVDPEIYEKCLPKRKDLYGLFTNEDRRGMDFVERSPKLSIKRSARKDDEISFPYQLRFSPTSTDAQNMETISKWYQRRALEIETFTYLPDLTEKFLTIAVKFGFEQMKILRDEFVILRRLNYECRLENSIDYHHFAKLSPIEVAKNMLHNKTGQRYARDFFEFVLPYFRHCEKKYSETVDQLIYKFFVDVSKTSLKPLYFILQYKSSSMSDDEKSEPSAVFSSTVRWELLFIDCLNACDDDASSQLETAFHILALLPVAPVNDGSTTSVVERRLKAIEVLSARGIRFGYSEFRRLCENRDEACLLLKRLIRHAIDDDVGDDASSLVDSRKLKSVSTRHWRNLLDDMLNLCDLAFSVVPTSKCLEIFIDGLLCSKNRRVIKASLQFVSTKPETTETEIGKLSYHDAELLILSAGLAYIDEAATVDDDALEYANLCFSLLSPPSSEIRRQADFVKALPILASLGVKDLPSRLRLYIDKSRLIEECLTKNEDAYKHVDRIAQLAEFLRVPDEDSEDSRAYALTMCAESALRSDDFSMCWRFCVELMESKRVEAWEVCFALAEKENFRDNRSKYDLLQFCSMYCDDDRLESSLNAFVKVKNEVFLDKFHGLGFGDICHKLLPKADWKQIRFGEVRLDPIYSAPASYEEKLEAKLESDKVVDLIDLAKVAAENLFETDVDTLEQRVYCDVVRRTLNVNSFMAVSILLNFVNTHLIEECLSKFTPSSTLIELAVYLTSLTFIRETVSSVVFARFLKMRPRDVIALAAHVLKDPAKTKKFNECVNKWKVRLNNLKQHALLRQLPEGVIDQERFDNDQQYRRDSILGFSLSIEEDSYLMGVRLAEQFGIDEWDVHWAHLTFLLTESGLEASSIQDYIKKRYLIEKLVGRSEQATSLFDEVVFPLLDGTKYLLLLLYYWTVEKLCDSTQAARDAQTHRTLLKHLSKYAPGVDYKVLIAGDTTSLDVVAPYMNADNFLTFAKVLTKIPSKRVTLEDVLSVWARKVFTETLPKVGVEDAFKKCLPVLLKLNAPAFSDFVRLILISDKSNKIFTSKNDDRRRTYELLKDLAKSNANFQNVFDVLQIHFEDRIAAIVEVKCEEIANTAVVEDQKETSEPDCLSDQVKKLVAQGRRREAGALLLVAAEVPPSLASHNAAAALLKQFLSEDDD